MHFIRAFLLLVPLALTHVATAANDIDLVGSPGWSIANGRCTFKFSGDIAIVNRSPKGSLSGSLRLCLWATPGAFPSSGHRVAIRDLDQLRGGYQYSDFETSTDATIPNVSGNFLFTVVVEQFDNGGWITSDYGKSVLKTLKNGRFVKTKKWRAPKGKVVAPKRKLGKGDILRLTLQGSKSGGAIVYVPDGSQLKLKVKIRSNGRTTVYGGSKPGGAPAKYTYRKTKDRYKGSKEKVGSIHLDYGVFQGIDSYSTYSLFFQSKKRGFYKGVDVEQGFSGTSWGVFRIQ